EPCRRIKSPGRRSRPRVAPRLRVSLGWLVVRVKEAESSDHAERATRSPSDLVSWPLPPDFIPRRVRLTVDTGFTAIIHGHTGQEQREASATSIKSLVAACKLQRYNRCARCKTCPPRRRGVAA